jgi:dTMP kinase
MEAFEKLKADENIFSVDGNRTPELIAGDIWQKVTSMLT